MWPTVHALLRLAGVHVDTPMRATNHLKRHVLVDASSALQYATSPTITTSDLIEKSVLAAFRRFDAASGYVAFDTAPLLPFTIPMSAKARNLEKNSTFSNHDNPFFSDIDDGELADAAAFDGSPRYQWQWLAYAFVPMLTQHVSAAAAAGQKTWPRDGILLDRVVLQTNNVNTSALYKSLGNDIIAGMDPAFYERFCTPECHFHIPSSLLSYRMACNGEYKRCMVDTRKAHVRPVDSASLSHSAAETPPAEALLKICKECTTLANRAMTEIVIVSDRPDAILVLLSYLAHLKDVNNKTFSDGKVFFASSVDKGFAIDLVEASEKLLQLSKTVRFCSSPVKGLHFLYQLCFLAEKREHFGQALWDCLPHAALREQPPLPKSPHFVVVDADDAMDVDVDGDVFIPAAIDDVDECEFFDDFAKLICAAFLRVLPGEPLLGIVSYYERIQALRAAAHDGEHKPLSKFYYPQHWGAMMYRAHAHQSIYLRDAWHTDGASMWQNSYASCRGRSAEVVSEPDEIIALSKNVHLKSTRYVVVRQGQRFVIRFLVSN